MRDKQEILDDLFSHAQKLDPQHYELAAVAMIETEVQIDIRDILEQRLISLDNTILKYIIPK
jgi:hypothetical protein